ncbi:Anoctamin-6 [Terramyces sp. JEL0728]|nr:Anoctamin-6 [Terramyces sp. JEL0728]
MSKETVISLETSIDPSIISGLMNTKPKNAREFLYPRMELEAIDKHEAVILQKEIEHSILNKKVLTDSIDNKLVLFMEQSDLNLFKEIKQFKKDFPAHTHQVALSKFASKHHSDALVRIIYGTPLDAAMLYDTTVKQTVHHLRKFLNTSEPSYSFLRSRVFLEILKSQMFIVLEISVHDIKHRFVQIVAPFETIAKEAEDQSIRMQLTDKCIQSFIKNHSGHNEDTRGYPHKEKQEKDWYIDNTFIKIMWQIPLAKNQKVFSKRSVPFDYERIHEFKGGDVERLGYKKVKQDFFSAGKRNQLVQSMILKCRVRLRSNSSHFSAITTLVEMSVFKEYYMLHDGPATEKNHIDIKNQEYNLSKSFRLDLKRFHTQFGYLLNPVEEIREYYGETVAFYFAWIEYYSIWLIGAIVIGVVAIAYGIYTSMAQQQPLFSVLDNKGTPFFAFAISIWSIYFVKYWKRQSNYLSFIWDMDDYHTQEVIRPQWNPTAERVSPITGKEELYEPSNTFRLKRSISLFVMFLAFLVLVAFIVGNIALTNFLQVQQHISYGGSVTSSLFAIFQILIFYPIYDKLVLWLSNFENHRTNTDFFNSLAWKEYVLSFVNNYGLLFFIAVVKPVIITSSDSQTFNYLGLWEQTCSSDSSNPLDGDNQCKKNLIISIAIIFTGQQILLTAWEFIYPWLVAFYDTKSEKTKISGAEPEYMKEKDLVQLTRNVLSYEYASKVIQLGNVLLFSALFPLAPILAWSNDIFEKRLDIIKFVDFYRRNFVEGANSIGIWEAIISSVVYLGIFTNGVVITFLSDGLEQLITEIDPDVSSRYKMLVYKLFFLIVYEHLLYMISSVLDYYISDAPQAVRDGREAEQYIRNMWRAEEIKDEEEEFEEAFSEFQSLPID